MRVSLIVAMLTGLLAFASCTTEEVERGAIGAAIGAVGAEALDRDPVTGAAVGAAIGIATADE